VSDAHDPILFERNTILIVESSRHRTYKSVANQTAKNGYRPDLREAAVQRVSAIRRSQRPVKPEPEQKLRGNKAKAAAESS
jgi:large subunit ribosomal protein L28e